MKCVDCPNGVAFGCKYCVSCLKKAKERSKARYELMKKNRLCKSCGGKVLAAKGIYCEKCRAERKDTWSKRKKQGLCITCGKHKVTNGLKCETCFKAYKENGHIKKKARLAAGLCAFCDEARVGTQLCLKHYLKFTAKTHLGGTKHHKELHDLFMKQGGICPYTGKILSLGKDASVDHIVPKSRGGSTELSNLQWVYYQVNFMKGDMFHEEFLELIGLIKLRFKMEDF